MLDVTRKREERFKYLKTLYTMVGGSPQNTANHHEIQIQSGLDPKNAEEAFYYLLEEKLLKASYLAGLVQITHEGIKHYEQLLQYSKNHSNKHDTASPTNVTIGKITHSNVEVTNRNVSCLETPELSAISQENTPAFVPTQGKHPASTHQQNKSNVSSQSNSERGRIKALRRFFKEQLITIMRQGLSNLLTRLFWKQ